MSYRTVKSYPLIIGALWFHFFWSLIPTWRFGTYYEYGFLVPVLALAFAWRRAAIVSESSIQTAWEPSKPLDFLLLGTGLAALFALILLRIVETGDFGWRPPIFLHGAVLVLATHLMVAKWKGWKVSGYFFPVTIFAWSAVPYFGRIENDLVRLLTDWVIGFTREIFLLQGYPVEQVGERLGLGSQVVEVTDGCSGIRSIQSLVMAALFFGELLWLTWPSRAILITAALGVAMLCNTGRAWFLAFTQFSNGADAAHAAHDPAGHVAFAVAALLLLGVACLLRPRHVKKIIITSIRAESDDQKLPSV